MAPPGRFEPFARQGDSWPRLVHSETAASRGRLRKDSTPHTATLGRPTHPPAPQRSADLPSLTPRDRGRRLRPDAGCAGLVDSGAIGGDASDDGLGRSVSVPSAAHELTLCRCGSADHSRRFQPFARPRSIGSSGPIAEGQPSSARGKSGHSPSASFDHVVGEGEQRLRDRQTERRGGLEVNDQLELGRPFDWNVAGLCPF